MKLKNITYNNIRHNFSAGYMVFCIGLLAYSTGVSAQNENAERVAVKKPEITKHKSHALRSITGRVVDADGKPVFGAIVKAMDIEGYSTLTEEDGTYKLELPAFATSVMITEPKFNSVVIGLQKGEKQRDATMHTLSFTQDYNNDINRYNDKGATSFSYTSALNIKEEIQKQLGGVAYTRMRNGTPGIGADIFVNGINSLNVNAQPLVVVDGVVLDQQYGRSMIHSGFTNDILSNISPADIEKVTVLRNGTALYGAKGANGVVIIETRRCKSLATRISATISAGVTATPRFVEMMDAEQYRGYASEMLKTTSTRNREFKFLNNERNYYYYNQYHNNTDWKDKIYHTAITQNYGITVEGGDNVAMYNLSVGYTKANSTLKYNDMSRLNVRFNTDISLIKNLSVRFDASFSDITRDIRDDGAPAGYTEGTPTSPSFLAYVKAPFLSPYAFGRGIISDSQLDIVPENYLNEALANYADYNWKLANPVALNEYAEASNKNRFENSLLNISVRPEYRITPNLSVSEHFSYTLVNTNEKYYIPINGVPAYYVSAVNGFRTNEVRSLFSKQNSVMSDTRINWHNRYGGHDIMLFGGARILWESYLLNNQLGYNTGSDKTPFMSSGLMNATSFGTKDNWNSLTYYLQANYAFNGKYYLQGNVTVDGSSRFGADADGLSLFGVSWGVFPSLQASWVVSNESWMANVRAINYLRLTAGYDVSGNDDIDYYAARSYLRSKVFLHALSGLTIDGIGNTKIKWETTRRVNVGIDAKLLDNRLAFAFNVFKSWTSDLLTMQSVGILSGLDSNWSNGGKLENSGFDVTAMAKVVSTRDWQWEIGGSIGHYKNKLTELPDDKAYIDTELYGGVIRSAIGQPVNMFYGYKTEGVFATSEQAKDASRYILDANGVTRHYFGAGDVIFVDKDGNNEINVNDRFIIGDPNPDIYGNISTSLSYRNIRLDVCFNYSLGNDVYNYMRSQLEGGSRFMNQTTNLLGRWQAEGQVTDVPKITFQDPLGNSRFSDRWIEDGSYIRLKTVTLSYRLPVNSQYIQGLELWLQGNNLLTFSKYLGSDPEFSTTTSVIGQGIDCGQLPQSASVVAGVRINL